MFEYFKKQEAEDGVMYRNRLTAKIKEINIIAFEGKTEEELMNNYNNFINLISLLPMTNAWDKNVELSLTEDQRKVYTTFPISNKVEEYEFFINYSYFNNLTPDEFINNDECMRSFNYYKTINLMKYNKILENLKEKYRNKYVDSLKEKGDNVVNLFSDAYSCVNNYQK